MSDKTPVLTKKDLRRCALRSWINVNLFNYETQLGGAVAFAEAKALRKLRHPSRSKKLKDYMT